MGYHIHALFAAIAIDYGDANEPPNASRDFGDYPVDELGAKNDIDENVVYDDQPPYEENIQCYNDLGLDDLVCLWLCLKHCYLLCVVYVRHNVCVWC